MKISFRLVLNAVSIYAVLACGGGPTIVAQTVWQWDSVFADNMLLGGQVDDFANDDSTIVVCGSFDRTLTGIVRGICRIDGDSLAPLGLDSIVGLDGPATAVACFQGLTAVSGSFHRAGIVAAERVALWDGAAWSGLGLGLNGDAATIAMDSHFVYVGGQFDSVDAARLPYLARWDLDSMVWRSMGTAPNGPVFAIATTDSGIFVGGKFDSIGGLSARGLARWRNGSWSNVGSFNGAVHAIAEQDGEVFVGGSFDSVGSTSVQNVAKLSGGTWGGVGNGVNGIVFAIAAADSLLFVGGRFDSAGSTVVANIAVLRDSIWDDMDGGVPGQILAIHYSPIGLLVGGQFNRAGPYYGSFIARWYPDSQTLVASVRERLQGAGPLERLDATATGIALTLCHSSDLVVEIVRVDGVSVYRNTLRATPAGRMQLEFGDLSLSHGAYFVTVTVNSVRHTVRWSR